MIKTIPMAAAHPAGITRALGIMVLGVLLMPPVARCHAQKPVAVDRVLVKKSARILLLYRDHRVVRRYPIGLGRNPVGDKQREGDSRTPEGYYHVDYRNPHSRFHLSLHISYPDKTDIIRARKRGLPPGGNIMIHGMPNGASATDNEARPRDWTAGCIAVSNQAIEEIWKLVPVGTPIEIRP